MYGSGRLLHKVYLSRRRLNAMKKRVSSPFEWKFFFLLEEKVLKYDKRTYGEGMRSELMCRNYDVKQISSSFFWQAASAIAKKENGRSTSIKKNLRDGVGTWMAHNSTEDEAKDEKKSFISSPTAQSDAFALLCVSFRFCADFIDYMKRIQIAAQECNIRFLNPILGSPEKPRCTYIYFFMIVFLYFSPCRPSLVV